MRVTADFIDEVMGRSYLGRAELDRDPELSQFLDRRPIPMPYPNGPTGEVKLVIIGQDPTIRRESERDQIKTVLNLHKGKGPLWNYAQRLCRDLGVSLEENVYATNACKNFFTQPPTEIREQTGKNVLEASATTWLPLLTDELAHFPDAMVISLGELVLSMLVRQEANRQMKYYWGYHKDWKKGLSIPMSVIRPEESTVGRTIFPIIHQPSLRGGRTAFYKHKWNEYVAFIKVQQGIAGS